MKVVYIGKDQQPVTIIQMISISKPAWRKSACFESLRNTVYSLVDSHSVAELTSFIANELPLDTGSSFQASQIASKSILHNILQVEVLEPVAFLNSKSKEIAIGDPADLSTRPEDISFIKMRCTMDGESQDARVTRANAVSFQFCLRLPQHSFDVASSVISTISTPVAHGKASTARSLNSCFSASSPTAADLLQPSSATTPPGTPINTSAAKPGLVSPAMKLFYLRRMTLM